MENILDIDAALQIGLTYDMAEMTPLEFRGLMALRRSRAMYEKQQDSFRRAAERR